MSNTEGAIPVPEGCTEATFRLMRSYFVANFLDGDDAGTVTISASRLASEVAGLFSSSDWTETWNNALFESLEATAARLKVMRMQAFDAPERNQ